MKLFLPLILCLIGPRALGVESKEPPPTCITTPRPESVDWEFSLGMNLLVPDRLPRFEQNVVVYGPRISRRVFSHYIDLQGTYGVGEYFYVWLGEVLYRVPLPIPFLNTAVLGGAHFLRYTLIDTSTNSWGGVAGLFFSVPLEKHLDFNFATKVYFAERSILALQIGFSFLL